MAVPNFDEDGLLPPGRHEARVEDVEDVLVRPFTESLTRERLFDLWKGHRAEVGRLVALEEEWLNGSFVTSKVDPADTDVVAFLAAENVDDLNPADRQRLAEVVDNGRSKARWRCDLYVVVKMPERHPKYAQYRAARDYWDRWWGHTRGGDPKGYPEVR